MNQDEAATLLGVDVRTIRGYSKMTPPIPVTKANVRNAVYDGPEIVRWFVDFEINKYKATLDYTTEDKNQYQTREVKAKAELKEIEVAKANGELLLASDVELEWTNIAMTIRQILLNVPHKLAMSIDDGLTYDEKKIKATILIEEALKYMAENSSGEHVIS